MPEDIGENLVGSYLRYVEGCEFVVYNTHLPGVQGEIDVVALKLGEPRVVYFCEVITHIRGVLYGTYDRTVTKVEEKVGRARRFAQDTFPADQHRYEIWSPVVPSGMTRRFEELAAWLRDDSLDVAFITNDTYTARVQKLIDHARRNTSATSEPAYRLLQVLTSARGTLTL